MIDLSKPIRWKTDKIDAFVSERFDNFIVVRWKMLGQWMSTVIPVLNIAEHFENLPPAPRVVTVWPVWTGIMCVALERTFTEAELTASCYHDGRVRKPVEIKEEYPE